MNEMTLTPEKLDEIERLAEDVKKAGSWASDEYDHYMDFITQAFENPATVRELVRLARIGHCFVHEAASPLKMRRLHELAQACKEAPHD